jgi:hypothetical protein
MPLRTLGLTRWPCHRSSYDNDIMTRNWGTSIDTWAVVGSAGLYGGSLTIWNTVPLQGGLPQIVVPFTATTPHSVSAVRVLVRGQDAPQDMDLVCLECRQGPRATYLGVARASQRAAPLHPMSVDIYHR